MLPLIYELSSAIDPLEALRCFVDLSGTLLFESAQKRARLGRFSFLTADPYQWFDLGSPKFGSNPFEPVRQAMRSFPVNRVPHLPPFQGGAAGLLGYELGRCWERIPPSRYDEFQFPVLAIGLYDWVLAWDHVAQRSWIISQGFPALGQDERKRRATDRIDWVLDRLGRGPTRSQSVGKPSTKQICQQFEVPGAPGVTSTFSPDEYRAAVQRIIEYVRAGDVFQVNLAHRLLRPSDVAPDELYAKLRHANPAPFAAYFQATDWAIASASPERFIQITDGRVETRPIKGTRRRSADPQEDLTLQSELLASEKDRAENVMIVDLLRNDLSKVCRPGTIQVPELCTLETYETVHHLVSAVTGELAVDKTAWDLLPATLPGGSITGAPKVRAMEIIHELEPTARGPYCGSLFYLGFDGTFDSSILIRTMAVKGGWVQFGVGGGVTASSDAQAEYDETLHKAEGLLRAVKDCEP